MRGGRGMGGEARFVMVYKGLRLWEVQCVAFYLSCRLSGGRPSTHAVRWGGSAKERPSRAWGERERGGGSICNVLRGSEAPGGSFVCVLRVGEALGGQVQSG